MPVSTKSKTKRKSGRPRDERVRHIIEIVDWTWDPMFGLGHGKFSKGPYEDFRHINIVGKLLRPTNLSPASAEVMLFPYHHLVESEWKSTDKPKCVGWVTHRGKQYSANLLLPSDAMGPVLQMLIAGKYKYVFFEAEKSFRGEAGIRYYRFSGTVEEDELSD